MMKQKKTISIFVFMLLIFVHGAQGMDGVKTLALSSFKKNAKCMAMSGLVGATGYVVGCLSKKLFTSEKTINNFKREGFSDGVKKISDDFATKLKKILPILIVENKLEKYWDIKLKKLVDDHQLRTACVAEILDIEEEDVENKSYDELISKATLKDYLLIDDVKEYYVEKDSYEFISGEYKKLKISYGNLGKKLKRVEKKKCKERLQRLMDDYLKKLKNVSPGLFSYNEKSKKQELIKNWDLVLRNHIDASSGIITTLAEILNVKATALPTNWGERLLLKSDVMKDYVLKKE